MVGLRQTMFLLAAVMLFSCSDNHHSAPEQIIFDHPQEVTAPMFEEIDKLLASGDRQAVIINYIESELAKIKLCEKPYDGMVSEAQREAGMKTYEEQFARFRSLNESCLGHVRQHLGAATFAISNWARDSGAPSWAPGFYAEWVLTNGDHFCVLSAGDGNPEEDFILLIGIFPADKREGTDPWNWDWQDPFKFCTK